MCWCLCVGVCVLSCVREEQPGFGHLLGGKRQGGKLAWSQQKNLLFPLRVELTKNACRPVEQEGGFISLYAW